MFLLLARDLGEHVRLTQDEEILTLDLTSVPPYFEYRTSSPLATSSGMRFSPSSSHLPSPTARTLPRCGFSLAVSGRTMPLAVVSSSSIA